MMDFQEEKYWLFISNGFSWHRRLCRSLVRSGYITTECQPLRNICIKIGLLVPT